MKEHQACSDHFTCPHFLQLMNPNVPHFDTSIQIANTKIKNEHEKNVTLTQHQMDLPPILLVAFE